MLQKLTDEGRSLNMVFVGDSILRGAYHGIVYGIVQLHAEPWIKHEIMHFNKTWYHEPQYFCCQPLELGGAPQCTWGRRTIEFQGSIFDEVAGHQARGAAFCLTFLWAPFDPPVKLQGLADSLKAGGGMYPDAIITNAGLHQVSHGSEPSEEFVPKMPKDLYAVGEELHHLKHKERGVSASSDGVHLIFQDLTALDDERIMVSKRPTPPGDKGEFNEKGILQYNWLLHHWLSILYCLAGAEDGTPPCTSCRCTPSR